jgi:hypothetical protein
MKLSGGLALAVRSVSCALAAGAQAGDPPTGILSFDFWLGAVFVLLHSYDRFNTPHTNRASTTAARYFVGVAAYLFVALVTYFVVGRYRACSRLQAVSCPAR